MPKYDPRNAPYQVSRADLREAYGARAITNGGQSPLDTTPSGRQSYLEGRGLPQTAAKDQVESEFRKNFKFRLGDQMQPQLGAQVAPRMLNRQMIQQPIQNPIAQEPLPFNQGGLASPEDVGRVRARGAASGSFQTPYGPVSFGLLPQTQPAEDMSEFIPSTTGPLSNFSLPKTQAFKRTSGIYG